MRAALLVDNANLLKHLDYNAGPRPIRIDFEALPRVLAREASRLAGVQIDFAVRCLYCTHRNSEDVKGRKRFHDYLHARGWSISDRPSKEYPDGHWEDKGVDLEIALDAQGLPLDVKGFIVGWETRMARELRTATTPIYLEPLLPEITSAILPARAHP